MKTECYEGAPCGEGGERGLDADHEVQEVRADGDTLLRDVDGPVPVSVCGVRVHLRVIRGKYGYSLYIVGASRRVRLLGARPGDGTLGRALADVNEASKAFHRPMIVLESGGGTPPGEESSDGEDGAG